MQEQILMPDADIRNRGTEECVGKSGQKFVEVDHDFRPCFLNTLIDITHAAKVFRCTYQVINKTLFQISPLIFSGRQKIRTGEALYGCLNTPVKETG